MLAGDSAGGGYALTLAQALRDRGAAPARLVLSAPWVDLTGSAPEYVVAPGLLHVYPLLPVPEARDAVARIVDFCTHG